MFETVLLSTNHLMVNWCSSIDLFSMHYSYRLSLNPTYDSVVYKNHTIELNPLSFHISLSRSAHTVPFLPSHTSHFFYTLDYPRTSCPQNGLQISCAQPYHQGVMRGDMLPERQRSEPLSLHGHQSIMTQIALLMQWLATSLLIAVYMCVGGSNQRTSFL